MKVWGAIFNIIAVMILMLMLLVYTNMSTVIQRDFDQIRLNHAVDYATEAMFATTLTAEDIDLDYSDIGKVRVDSSDALDVFCSILCLSYNMSMSDENFAAIENSISALALAGNDGYYIGKLSDYDSSPDDGILVDSQRMRWSVKIPYFISQDNYAYAVNYEYNNWSRVSLSTTGSNILNSTVRVSTEETLPMGITQEIIAHEVNSQIRDSLMAEIQRKNDNKTGFNFKFYLPDVTTVNHVNSIEPPAILLVMEGVDFASTEKINALSVAGFKVTKKVNVIAFVDKDTNRSYYCYESQLRDEERDECCGGTGSFHVENYYASMKDASEAISPTTDEHYSPYYDILTRKITKE